MVVLTGDMHGQTGRIYEFCSEYETTAEDVMIILGDFIRYGYNFAVCSWQPRRAP